MLKARILMKTSMRFDLVDLRLFLFVVEAASITHGADGGAWRWHRPANGFG
jgi:hypothetical protein